MTPCCGQSDGCGRRCVATQQALVIAGRMFEKGGAPPTSVTGGGAERAGGDRQRRGWLRNHTFQVVAFWLIGAALSAVIDTIQLWPLVRHDGLAPGEMSRGRFDVVDGRPMLELFRHSGPDLFPDHFLDGNQDLVVLPGNSAAVALTAPSRYVVTNASRPATPPYCVFGVESAETHADHGERYLLQAQVPVIRDGQLGFVEWNADLPWRHDNERLEAIERTCNPAGADGSVLVVADADGQRVRIGQCSVELPVVEPAARERRRLVFIGGPDGLVARKAGGFRLEHTIFAPVAVLLVPKVLLTTLAFGPIGSVASSLALLVGSRRLPDAAAITWVLLGLAAVMLSVWQLAGWLTPRHPWWRFGARLVLVVALGARAWSFGARANARHVVGYDELRPDDPTPRTCLVTGYSTAWGDKLSDRSQAAWGELGRSCSTCGGNAGVHALRGGLLSWVRDMLCAPTVPLAPGGTVIFYGGTNDEVLWGSRGGLSVIEDALQLIRYSLRGSGSAQFLAVYDRAVQASSRTIDEQDALLRDALRCVAGRGGHFLYVQDFLIFDVGRPRSAARQLIADHRRAVVESAGGRFIALLPAVSDRLAVSWFNDFIHLSRIGHREAAAVMCDAIAKPFT